MQRLSRVARVAALVTHLLLILLLVLQGSNLTWVGAGLLLLSLPGLWLGKVYTYQWTCMLIAVYCALWLAEGWADREGRGAAFMIAAVAAAEFVSLVLYVRLLGRERSAPAVA